MWQRAKYLLYSIEGGAALGAVIGAGASLGAVPAGALVAAAAMYGALLGAITGLVACAAGLLIALFTRRLQPVAMLAACVLAAAVAGGGWMLWFAMQLRSAFPSVLLLVGATCAAIVLVAWFAGARMIRRCPVAGRR